MVKLKCPNCKIIFTRDKRTTHLCPARKSIYNCTCCSNHCRGVLYNYIQYQGLTHELKVAISENVLAEYREFISYIDEDNSEETDL